MAPIKRKLPSPPPTSPQQLTPYRRTWTDADMASLLRAAVAFRSATGSLPSLTTMPDFLPFLENSAIATSLSHSKLYHKLRRIKKAYISPSPTHPLPDPIRRLSAELWGGGRKKKRRQDDGSGQGPVFTASDEVELLRGAIAFRHITGAIPKLHTMGEFLPYIKGYFSSDSFDEQMVYDKLGQLQERYSAAGLDGPDRGWHARLLYELSADVWGGKEFRPAIVVDKEVVDVADVAVVGTDGSQEPERDNEVTKDDELDEPVVAMKRPRTSNKIWTDSDEVELLRGVIAYCSAKGSIPKVDTMGELLPFVDGKFSVAFTSKQLYDKFIRLRHRYKDTNARDLLPNSHNSLIYELSTEVWGEKDDVTVSRKEHRPRTRRFASDADGIVKEVATESIKSSRAFERRWSNENEIALLRGAISIRPFSDYIPKRSTMKELLSHVDGHLSAYITEEQAYSKLRRLRGQYLTTDADSLDENSHSRAVYELSAEVWGCPPERTDVVQFDEGTMEDTVRKEVGRGANDSFPFLREAATEYWKANNLSRVYLEKAWKSTDPDKCKRLEEKWRKFNNDRMKCQLKKLDLTRELLVLFMDATRT
ncbi:putative myristoylated alanine-rich C-kinase substrate [Iris pallida]|uniref:Myristoylated alanine-rich C-kinase substrate n=1 Tax=Iris pallida TaxID=29817 RepID=A0AAX6DP21_IRIPA|nr:putative myristoylated alanine-rich C-kinase substrate [Iris pallida]